MKLTAPVLAASLPLLAACQSNNASSETTTNVAVPQADTTGTKKPLSKPLVPGTKVTEPKRQADDSIQTTAP